MLHDTKTLSSLIMYAQSIEESKLKRRGIYVKRGRTHEQSQLRCKKRTPNQDVPIAPKANYERGGGSQLDKPIISNYGKKHFGKCLAGSSGCYGCRKNDH